MSERMKRIEEWLDFWGHLGVVVGVWLIVGAIVVAIVSGIIEGLS